MKQAVIVILVKGSKALLEKRLPTSTLADHFLFPGGTIEENELDNPTLALMRESREELGIIPTEFIPLSILRGELGTILKPFLVLSWEGEIPTTILDRGNPVFWEEIEMVTKSPLSSVSQMMKEAQKILSANL